MPRVLSCCIAALLPAAFAASQTEPTAEETEVLAWINRFRRDPQAFGRLIVDGNRPENAVQVDWAMFTAELAALRPAPPLFFEPRLIDAARAHARYMVEAKEYGHHETAGRPGFTGEWPQDRAHAAGYASRVAECSIARGATPLETVAGYIVDVGPPGEGSGGMQDGRGHRRCMIDPKWREAGVGSFEWDRGSRSNVELFGEAPGVGRVLGGAAIEDRDGDEFYDAGEGLGGVHVAVGERCTIACGSGAWRVDVPGGDAATKLVARLGPLELVREVTAGTDNLQIDLLFDVRRAVRGLEAKLAALPDTATARRRALRLQLLELRAPATPADVQLAADVAALKATVLAGLGTRSRNEATTAFHAAKRPYAGTVIEQWIGDAQTVDALARDAASVRATKNAAARARRARATMAEIDRALLGIPSADLWRALAALRRELAAM